MSTCTKPTKAAGPVFEFEAICQSTLIQTWRVVIPDADSLTPEGIEEAIEELVFAADCDLLSQREDEGEGGRELRPGSVRRV